MKEKLHIVKIGGDVIDDPLLLERFLKNFVRLSGHKILVHGGGKQATGLADSLGVLQTMVEGRRVTDDRTLDIAVMVYAGLINKKIVAMLQAIRCNAIGLCGADGDLIRCLRREPAGIDFGFVGDVIKDGVNAGRLISILEDGIVPVFSAITHDGEGSLLNTNADSIASGIAVALGGSFETKLTYCLGKKGVLMNENDDDSFIPALNSSLYRELKAGGHISKGMVPKLDNAFEALAGGIKDLVICHADNVGSDNTNLNGTRLCTE